MPTTTYLLLMLVGFVLTITVETAVLLASALAAALGAGAALRGRVAIGLHLPGGVARAAAVLRDTVGLPSRRRDVRAGGRVRALLVGLRETPPAPRPRHARDFAAIVLANLCSFGLGELIHALDGARRIGF